MIVLSAIDPLYERTVVGEWVPSGGTAFFANRGMISALQCLYYILYSSIWWSDRLYWCHWLVGWTCERASVRVFAQVSRLQARIRTLEQKCESGEGKGCVAPCGSPHDEDIVCMKRSDLELLHLKEKAMDAIQEGITIADATSPDMPLIYINEGFSKMTGYPVKAVMHKNCRFLQGEGTDASSVETLKRSIKRGEPCVVQLTVGICVVLVC